METKKTNKITKSIIDVTVNGLTIEAITNKIDSRLQKIENNAFNVALMCAYATGITIPAYVDNKGVEHQAATIDKKITQQKLLENINRSHSTVSRWLKAFNALLENGYFDIFASGALPFSFDKIIIVMCDCPEAFKGQELTFLMSMSCSTLKGIMSGYEKNNNSTNKQTNTNDESQNTNDENQEEEQTEKSDIESGETFTITIEGNPYTVNKSSLIKWLMENDINNKNVSD